MFYSWLLLILFFWMQGYNGKIIFSHLLETLRIFIGNRHHCLYKFLSLGKWCSYELLCLDLKLRNNFTQPISNWGHWKLEGSRNYSHIGPSELGWPWIYLDTLIFNFWIQNCEKINSCVLNLTKQKHILVPTWIVIFKKYLFLFIKLSVYDTVGI